MKVSHYARKAKSRHFQTLACAPLLSHASTMVAARPNSGSQVAFGSSSPVPALASAEQLVLRLRKLGGAQPVALSASAERLRRRVDYFGRLLFSPEAAARCRQTAGANCALGAPMQQSAWEASSRTAAREPDG